MKHLTLKNCMLFMVAMHFSLVLNGQTTMQPIAPSVPTSPQAEAFQRYGDMSINYSTGIPDISIPLFEINHHGYRLPITLKYNPQPLRPGYNYDVYGHGWGLPIGGCISRTISYLPDEWRDFKLEPDKLSEYLSVHKESIMQKNLGYDNFTANLPDGSSFEFIIRRNDKSELEYIVSDNRMVKISCTSTPSNINTFTIVDEQGVKYSFSGADVPYRNHTGVIDFSASYVSWQLTKIELPNLNQPITFTYGQYMESDYMRFMNEATIIFHHAFLSTPPKGSVAAVPDYQPYFYRMQLLTSISYGSTDINWKYNTPGNVLGYNYVNAIEIKDNNKLIRKIEFNKQLYNYTYDGYAQNSIAKLQNLSISGTSGDPLVYQCTYTSNGGSFAGTDHWGYLNNYTGRDDIGLLNVYIGFSYTDLLPSRCAITKLNKSPQDLCPYDKIRLSAHTYDNRAPLPPNSHGVLRTLKYPTGGYTQFDFENHQFLSSTDANGDYIHDKNKRVIKNAAGFRITKITNYTSTGSVANARTFAYGKGNASNKHTGVGEAVVDPNILTYANYTNSMSYPLPYMLLGLSTTGKQEWFTNPLTPLIGIQYYWGWECSFGVGNFRRILNGRIPVVYSEVTEYHGDIYANGSSCPERTTGKTVYKYDIYDYTNYDTVFFEKTENFGNNLSYSSKKYRYNLLKEKTDYVYASSYYTNYRMIRNETYSWNMSYQGIYNYQYTNEYHIDYPPSSNVTLRPLFTNKLYYLGSTQMSSRTVTTYDHPGYFVGQTESYGYNSRHQLIRKHSVKNSLDQMLLTTYTYPEITASTNDVIRSMVNKNIISPILEEKEQSNPLPTGSNIWDLAGKKVEYGAFILGSNTLYLPSKLYELNTLGYSSEYTLADEVLSYSTLGNPREVVSKDGIHTVYLWGYGDRYLIAEIKNATHSQVSAAVSSVFGMTVDALSQAVTPDATHLSNLRNNVNLNGAFVSTFTHEPLVGVTSMTEPSGRTTYYVYDNLSRLIESYYYEDNIVSTANKRTLNQYYYHNINQ